VGIIFPGPVHASTTPSRRLLPATPGLPAAVTLVLTLVALAVALLAGAGPALAQTEQGIRGTLNNAGERVPGATIVVEQDGEEVATAESDEQGQFSISVPEPGEYTVTLDLETLPEGVTVREEGGETREVTVRPGAVSPALFILGEGDRETTGTADRALQLFVRGVQFGLVIAMGAIGLSLIFGTTGVTNFAHGEFLTGGAIAAYFFNVTVGMNLIPATLLAVLVGAVFGALIDKGLWGPLRRRGTGLIAALVVSIGLALVMRYVYLYFIGGSARSYAQYATQQPLSLGPISIPPRDLVIMGLSVVVLTAVGLALIYTRIGKATRAVADNPSLAATSGIDVERVINVVWITGAALAVLGGVFLALSQQVSYLLGFQILLLLFAGVTLGGLGTAFGALVGSLVIGVFTQMSTLVIPAELQNVGALVVLILILVVRPQGILGRAERVG
jgi:neutral amino acid transport system permease protein